MIRKNNIIISLTSYKERLPFLSMTLDSLYKQKMQPDRIVLVLYNEDVEYIPLSIKKDIENGKIELIVCDEDLKSHNKYYYTMLKYPDDIVITIDDDLIYDDDLVSLLMSYYKKYPTCISARRVHRIIKGKTYNEWEHECYSILEPSMDLFATTGAGTLFPPNILKIEELDKDDIYACINADDVLLKHIEYKLGINTVWAKNEKQHPVKNKLCLFFSKQLSTFNVDNGGNDYYLSKFKCYE